MIWIFIESERSNQNKLLKEIRLYYTVVDFTDSANDDAGKTEETEIIMSDFDQQHSHKQGRKVQKLEYEKGRNHDYLCAEIPKTIPIE